MITTLNGVKTLGKATVIVDIVDKGNPEIRPAYAMNPSEIAIHNTGNSGRGANAKAHNVYIHNQSKLPVAKTGYASWHFSVDDKFIYQHLPLNETAWHTGDGSGAKSGNKNAIGIEICENCDMENYAQAEENAIALTVYLMKQLGIALPKVKPHQSYSGKFCPRVILKRDGSFAKFQARIKTAYEYKPVVKQVVKSKPKSHTVVKGDTFSGIAEKYDMKLSDVLAYNPRVKPETLQIGDVVHLVPVPVSVPKPVSKPVVKPTPKPTGLKAVGTIQIAFLNNFTYLYEQPNVGSKQLGKAVKGAKFQISGSVSGWYEVIYNGKRAYVKDKYAKKV